MSNPFAGISYMFRGVKLLLHPQIRPYVIIPLMINISVFIALFWFGAHGMEVFIDWITPELPGWLHWLSWLVWMIFTVVAVFIVFFCFSILANLIGAPFNGPLAAAVEAHLTGAKPQGDVSQSVIANIIPAVTNELKKIVYFGIFTIPLLILFFIPGINIIAPILWFIFTSWMLALEYIDYPAGNHDLLFSDQKRLISKRRFQSLGFGSIVSIATLTPIANFIVMPTAVIAATIYWVEQLSKEKP